MIKLIFSHTAVIILSAAIAVALVLHFSSPTPSSNIIDRTEDLARAEEVAKELFERHAFIYRDSQHTDLDSIKALVTSEEWERTYEMADASPSMPDHLETMRVFYNQIVSNVTDDGYEVIIMGKVQLDDCFSLKSTYFKINEDFKVSYTERINYTYYS